MACWLWIKSIAIFYEVGKVIEENENSAIANILYRRWKVRETDVFQL